MRTRRPPLQRELAPFPTTAQLEQMGLVRCTGHQACTTFVDPVNVPERKCQRHQCDDRDRRADTRGPLRTELRIPSFDGDELADRRQRRRRRGDRERRRVAA